MATAGNITAVLTLNATKFNSGLESSLGALEKFQNSILKFNSNAKGMGTAIDTLFQQLNHLNSELKLFNQSITNLNKFSQLSTAINKMANGLKILSSETVDVEKGINMMNNIFKAWGQTLNGTEIKIRGVKSSMDTLTSTESKEATVMEEVAVATRQYDNALTIALPKQREMIINATGVASAMEKDAMATEKDAMAKEKATASTQKFSNANKTLGTSLGMLRTGLTMVGSMIAYNFIHNLAMATTETINAKSEMEGYFQMLGYGKNDINEFNKALDETVKKFPRLNKYALGETISSIGVEFELSTKEMKKAMPVVSMITSEYLRAGRNVNEASLAVKDILQGEFQRLSRETGVKGEQLKEAGWSGDKNDVMGLLKALDKVGKSRNWDKFVAKANSLNDAVLITQNRFSEWSAEMVNKVQPTILKVFNDIMVVATSFSKVINGAMDWLSGNGIAQGIVKWGGLATVLGTVTLALIHYRTGANLVQIVQMGLTRSIGATILGLEAETVAEHGLTTSIIANITSTEAETVAKNGRLATITASILGLEAEAVAEYGLLSSIGATITGIELETFANMGLAESFVAVSVAIAPVILAFTSLALVLGTEIIRVNNAIDKHNKFINILDHGEEMVSEYKDTMDSLTAKKEKLEEKLSTLTEGTYKYEMAQDKLKATTDDLKVATDNYNQSVNATAWVRHKQELYDDSKQHSQLQTQKEINQALIDYGVNIQEANQIASPIWQDAQDGWDQQYETLQKVNLQYKKNSTTAMYWLDQLEQKKISPKEATILIKPIIKSGRTIAERKEEVGNASSLTEYVDKWLWLQVAQLEHSINEFNLNLAVGGLSDAIGGLAWGLVHFLGDHFVGAFVQNALKGSELDGIGNELGDSIKGFVEKSLLQIPQMLNITTAPTMIMPDLSNAIKEWFIGAIDSIDVSSIQQRIGECLGNIFSYDYIGEFLKYNGLENFDFGEFLKSLIPSDGNKSINVVEILKSVINFDDLSGVQELVDTYIIQPLINYITEGIKNTPVLGGIASFLGLGEDAEGEAETEGQNIGTSFNTGISTGLAPLDGVINQAFEGLNLDTITSNFTSNTATMTSNATSTATSVGASFVAMKNNHKSSVDSMVSNNTTAFRDMHDKSSTQMLAMRDSTSQTTKQMTDAWGVMRDGILASARKIQDESSKRFGDLGSVIGGFYKKIQNPSLWGSGSVSVRSHSPTPTSRRVGRAVFGHGAGGGSSTYSGNRTMSIGALKSKLCPNGDCGSIFDGYNYSDVVDVREFLASITGEHGFGWNFNSTHNQYIKNKSNEWDMKSPIINLAGGISTNTPFKVKEFDGGKTPHISFDKFQAIAGSIFSAIPYKHYMDSSWKGSWLGALMSGACNCSDGADALIALARTFGFSAYKQWGTWGDEGHFWAVINGVPMDTTAWQGGYGWTSPKVHGYGSANLHASSGDNKTVNVTVDMQGATIYGVDDLDSRIQDSVQKGLQAEFNDPYTISI